MTVTELKQVLAKLEAEGKGDYEILTPIFDFDSEHVVDWKDGINAVDVSDNWKAVCLNVPEPND